VSNQYINALTDLWNNAGTTYQGISLNVTNSASAAASKLLRLQIGGVDQFSVSKAGVVTATGAITGAGMLVASNDGGALGASGTAFSDLFLASGGVINWNAGDVTITHSANALAFGGATGGYSFSHAVLPTANDGAALGASGTAWSDLFLASGAVINLAAGDWVATHSTGILTVGTGDLRVTNAGTNAASVVTVGGTQTLTDKTLATPTITADATVSGAAGAKLAILATDTGAVGSVLELDMASASPSPGDEVGYLVFRGRDSAANTTQYARLIGTIVDATDGSEDGRLTVQTFVAGTNAVRLTVEAGLAMAGSGDPGAGKIAADGIKFPATQVASADVNTLDDYEEGTFTPAFSGSGCTFSYLFQGGSYTKIGNTVHFIAAIVLNTSGNTVTANDVSMTGLPFARANDGATSYFKAEWGGSTTSYVSVSAVLASAGTSFTFKGATAAATTSLSSGALDANALLHATNGSLVYVSGFYPV